MSSSKSPSQSVKSNKSSGSSKFASLKQSLPGGGKNNSGSKRKSGKRSGSTNSKGSRGSRGSRSSRASKKFKELMNLGKSVKLSEGFKSADWSKAEKRQVIIIGSGPAGLTAAIYTARANLSPLVLHGKDAGGQLMITSEVENYPSFVGTGPDLIMNMEKQAKSSGADFQYETISEVDFSKRPFKLLSSTGSLFIGDAIIIATGATAKYLGIPSEQKLMNKGVSACATCDGALYRNQTMAVVGGGDSAAEEALFLTRLAPVVHLIHRRDSLRASKIMAKRVLEHPKIKIHWDSEVQEVVGEEKVEGVVLKNRKTGATDKLEIGALFIAIGHVPQTAIFSQWLPTDELGYLTTHAKSTYTDIEGVFACGDSQDHVYRQAVTAAGTGCMAAIDAERWLAELESGK